MKRSSRHGRRAACAATAALLLFTGACSSSDAGDGILSSGSEANAEVDASGNNDSRGNLQLFDSTAIHDIAVSFDDGDFEAMIATYESTGDKEWIEATVTIDGSTYEQAGLRLKGNSSLRGASQSAAEELPWLVRLDKFVDGQTHQGYEDIVVRSNSSTTALNEAVALDLLAEAGLASMAAAHASFTVNDSEAKLRLIVEHPDDDAWYESAFDNAGALYKSESTGDWSYRGDDPNSYIDVFDQEGGSDVADLTPLIDLLQFLDEADDATFAAELPERLDVDAFATYLAMMDLVGNFDDIDGPGNNSYLWWDAETEQFTVVPWDLNLAFGASPGGGGPMPGGGGAMPNGGDPRRENGAPPGGGSLPDRGDMPSERGGRGGGFGRSNPLVERFHANATFEALYQKQLTELRSTLFDSGRALEMLNARTETLLSDASGLVDEATIRAESERIAAELS